MYTYVCTWWKRPGSESSRRPFPTLPIESWWTWFGSGVAFFSAGKSKGRPSRRLRTTGKGSTGRRPGGDTRRPPPRLDRRESRRSSRPEIEVSMTPWCRHPRLSPRHLPLLGFCAIIKNEKAKILEMLETNLDRRICRVWAMVTGRCYFSDRASIAPLWRPRPNGATSWSLEASS